MQSLRTASLLFALTLVVAVYSRGGRVYRPGDAEEDKKYVTDPSAKVEGIFRKEGDMTFIMNSDPLADDFESGVDSNERKRRNAVLNPGNLWPNAEVPYEVSSVFNNRERTTIFSAMRHWEEKTCIRFRPKRSSDQYSILIMSGPTGVCQSFVGRIHSFYQPQGVTLGQYCVHFSTVVHEIGHAIGFYHEHNRPDRDEHIEVRLDNVYNGIESAFNKAPAGTTNLLGYGYDYASIMHYSADAFSANGQDTIVAKDSNIPFGDAEELSPLDIAKANKLYSCGPSNTWPPINIVVPVNTISLPQGYSCGLVSDGQTSGTFTTPGFPSHRHNLDCAYVINVPKGYYIEIELNRFTIEESSQCTKDYVRIYYGNELTSSNIARFSGSYDGRICDDRGYNLYYTIFDTTVTVVIHTDSAGSRNRGVNVTFTARDEDECRYGNQCHECVNFPGGFECVCRDGYYHSPAAGTCYDVNECAYDNGGCEHTCTNSGGSYECTCNDGYFLQADGKSCRTTPPVSGCGSNFTTSTGSFQTPNWPETYPTNIQCEWFITLPDAKQLVELSCEESPYGIAGAYPDCTKDHMTFYDGHSLQSDSHGPYCHFTRPGTLKMSSNRAKVVFYAGPAHSSSRKGAKCSFRAVDAPTPPPTTPPTTIPTTKPPTTTPATKPPTTTPTTKPPTTPPPTTPPAPKCGGVLNTESGSFQTPNWPETYPTDIECEWLITLPDANKLVQLSCEESPYGIAGNHPECTKDHVTFYDGHDTQSESYGPYCGFTRPGTLKMSSNLAKVVFYAGPAHSPSRRGIKCNFISVDAPTLPPTLPPCGGTLTAATGSFSTPNWPSTYPVDIDCTWRIILPDSSKRVELSFDSGFGIAGSLPSCTKDTLYIHDDQAGTQYGPFCHWALPDVPLFSSNEARLVFRAGPAHSPSRRGFSATYRSV